ncbi:hypothetical protein [Brevibacillus sp. NRS-1366]|uniref:hypothetical protein n=1 Tax=Brevibacillus sp. NRS-1366 TaxID=3233899 RepID=UPI003D25BACD
MSITDSTVINIYNVTDNQVAISTYLKPSGILLEATRDDVPYAIQLTVAEVKGINTQSNVFKEGILRFDTELEKEIYELLGIRDWEEILSDQQIRETILRPSVDALQKVIKTNTPSMIERFRGMLVMLENSRIYDVSQKAKEVILARYYEIYQNTRVSNIILQVPQENKSIDEDQLTKIKEELAAKIREELMAELKAQKESSKTSKGKNVEQSQESQEVKE